MNRPRTPAGQTIIVALAGMAIIAIVTIGLANGVHHPTDTPVPTTQNVYR